MSFFVERRATVVISMPCRLRSEMNTREHHHVKARRTKAHRAQAHMLVSSRLHTDARGLKPPVIARLTYLGPRRLDDDNLRSACKAVRDGIADAFGVGDEKGSGLTWEYEQELSPLYALRIELRPGAYYHPDQVRITVDGVTYERVECIDYQTPRPNSAGRLVSNT